MARSMSEDLNNPYLFSENFQSDEDYYQSFLLSSAERMLRYFCFFLSISIPAVFIAISVDYGIVRLMEVK